MRNGLSTLDYLVFLFYILGVSGYGYYIYKRKQTSQLNSQDYFLAEGSLTWWAMSCWPMPNVTSRPSGPPSACGANRKCTTRLSPSTNVNVMLNLASA